MAKPSYFPSILHIAAFAATFALAVLAVVFTSQSLQAQSGKLYPSVPTNVSVTVSNNTALITWQSGGRGVGGSCPTDDYFVRVYDMSDGDTPILAQSAYILQPDSGNPSRRIGGLAAGVLHRVEVYAYGACDEYSKTPGTAQFLTKTDDSEDGGGDGSGDGDGDAHRTPNGHRNQTLVSGTPGRATRSGSRGACATLT